MATLSSILAWKIPWTEEPGNLQSMGSQRVGHNLATKQQQKYIYIYILIRFFSIIGYYKIVNIVSIVPCEVQLELVAYLF